MNDFIVHDQHARDKIKESARRKLLRTTEKRVSSQAPKYQHQFNQKVR